MSNINTNPIKIQVRDINHQNITNAKVKVIAHNNTILFDEESQNGEIILDDIESLKNIHRFKVKIEHSHYQSHPKTQASCIRATCQERFHTLEFPYQTKLLVSSVYGEIREIETHTKDSTTNQSPKDRISKHIDNTISQSNKLDSTQSTMPSLHDKESKLYINDNKATIPNHSSSFVRFDNPSITQAKEIDQSIYHNPPNTSIYLKAYYNQDSIPNKDNQSQTQRQIYQTQKKQTKWGYVVFDKDIDIESKLKEMTKDSTIPIIKLKEFRRIYKEDSIAFYISQTNKSNNTSKINQDSNTIESETYLLGEEIELYFKEEWQDKQVRFFAYMEGAKRDVGWDIEIEEQIPPNVIRIETQDDSGEFIEIVFDEFDEWRKNASGEIKPLLFPITDAINEGISSIIDKGTESGMLHSAFALASSIKNPKNLKNTIKPKSLTKEEVLEIIKNLKKALNPNGKPRSRIYLVENEKELMVLWEKLTKNFKKEKIETNEKGTRITRVLDDGTEIHLRNYSSKQSGNTPTIDTKINEKDYKIHIDKGT